MTAFLAKGFLSHELGVGLKQKQILNLPVQGIPVIIVTAEDLLVAVGGTIEAGAVAVLQKPVYQDRFMAAVQQAMETI